MKINRKKLAALMIDTELNSLQLAKKSKVSRNTISAIRHGKTCSEDTVKKIASVFNVSAQELTDD